MLSRVFLIIHNGGDLFVVLMQKHVCEARHVRVSLSIIPQIIQPQRPSYPDKTDIPIQIELLMRRPSPSSRKPVDWDLVWMKAEIVIVFCLVLGGIAFIITRGPTYSNPKVPASCETFLPMPISHIMSRHVCAGSPC